MRNLNELPSQYWGFVLAGLLRGAGSSMAVQVDFKLRQRLSGSIPGPSLMGDGFLIRLRSTSIALLAAVVAIGLGLVAFISQMGWPTVFSGPIPAGPQLGVVQNDTIAAPPLEVRSKQRDRSATHRGAGRRSAGGAAAGVPSPVSADLAPSHSIGSPSVELEPPGKPAPPQPGAESSPSPEAAPPTPPRAGPPAAEDPVSPPPASPASVVEDDSPGKSGEAPGHTGEAPPPWAGSGGHGKPEWAGH